MTGLRQVVDEILESHRVLAGPAEVPLAPSPSTVLGCTEGEIAGLEARLGTSLPPSYRSFLREMDGCPQLGLNHGGLLPVAKVDWFRVNNTEWISAYTREDLDDLSEEDHRIYGPEQDTTRFRVAYLEELLQIGEVYAGTVYLLNPRVVDAAGEWEAWDFCDHSPGAVREPSLARLLESIRDDLRRYVRMAHAEFDEGRIIAESVAELRPMIGSDAEPDLHIVAEYVARKIQSDDSFAAWARRVHAPSALLNALRGSRG